MFVRRDARVRGDVKHDRVEAGLVRIALHNDRANAADGRRSGSTRLGKREIVFATGHPPVARCALFVAEEVGDERDGRRRILFHDPVPRLRDDSARDVCGHVAHARGHRGAERLLSSDCQHRHGQLRSLRHLVVLGVFCERSELREGGVHRTGLRVDGCVVRARRFVDSLGVRRELVVEAVEQDSLPTFDQPFDVGPAEVEVPGLR